MKNNLYYRSPDTIVVGFRISNSELEKLKETRKTLKDLGIKGTTSDTLRVILNRFDIESWKQDTRKALSAN